MYISKKRSESPSVFKGYSFQVIIPIPFKDEGKKYNNLNGDLDGNIDLRPHVNLGQIRFRPF